MNPVLYWTFSCKLVGMRTRRRPFLNSCGSHMMSQTSFTPGELWSYRAAIRALPVLHSVEHFQVISSARCNNLIVQSHRPTQNQERSQLGFKNLHRAQEFLALHARVSNLHQHTRTPVTARNRRLNQSKAHLAWRHAVDMAV